MMQVGIQGHIWQPLSERIDLTVAAIRSALGELDSNEDAEVDRMYAELQQDEADRDGTLWWYGG